MQMAREKKHCTTAFFHTVGWGGSVVQLKINLLYLPLLCKPLNPGDLQQSLPARGEQVSEAEGGSGEGQGLAWVLGVVWYCMVWCCMVHMLYFGTDLAG